MTASRSADRARRALSRISRHNHDLRAFTWVNRDAPAAARGRDNERAAFGPRSPLHGLTFAVKDNIDIAGLATTAGSAALTRAVAADSAPAVLRLLDAGAVLVGKTNMSELALSHGRLGYSATGATTRNPYNRSRNAAGSSSGSAAAVSAGLADFALGTDTVGSVRAPACTTGLVGIRPTTGLLDMSGVFPCSPSLDVIGPMARRVDTAAMALAAMVSDERFCRHLQLAARGGQAEGAKRTRIGFVCPVPAGHLDVRRTAEAASHSLAADGCDIIPVDLGDALSALWPVLDRIISAEFAPAVNAYLAGAGDAPADLDALVRASEDDGRINPATLAWLKGLADKQAVTEAADTAALRAHTARLRQLFCQHDLDAIAFPTMAAPASPCWDVEDETYACSVDDPFANAYLAPAAGFPEITVPVGLSRHGLPIGLSLMGTPYSEPRLIRIARRLQRMVRLPTPPGFD